MSSTSITLSAAAPSWVVAGMNICDTTAGANIGTVASVSSTTVTLTAVASHAGLSGVLRVGVYSAGSEKIASRRSPTSVSKTSSSSFGRTKKIRLAQAPTARINQSACGPRRMRMANLSADHRRPERSRAEPLYLDLETCSTAIVL
jgi:hypothetical protein